jgi:hypothetical protein
MSMWLAIPAVAAAALLLLLWRFVHPTPRLVIGKRGILQRDLGWGWIPWDEIEGAYPPTAGEADTLRLRLRVTERLARVLRRKRRSAADPAGESVEVRLDLRDTDVSAVDLLREILARQRPDRA